MSNLGDVADVAADADRPFGQRHRELPRFDDAAVRLLLRHAGYLPPEGIEVALPTRARHRVGHQLEIVPAEDLLDRTPEKRRVRRVGHHRPQSCVFDEDPVRAGIEEGAQLSLAVTQRLLGSPLVLLQAGPFKRAANRHRQPRQAFLEHVVRCAGLDALGGGLFAERTRDDDEWGRGRTLLDKSQRVHAVERGQVVVAEDDIGLEIGERRDKIRLGLDAMGGGFQSPVAQLALHQRRVGGHVLDDQDAQHWISDSRSRISD